MVEAIHRYPDELGGTGMAFDPFTLAMIWEGLFPGDAPTFDQDQWQSVVQGRVSAPGSSNPFASLPRSERDFFCRWEHEVDHWHRSLGTTFGILRFLVDEMRLQAAIGLAQRFLSIEIGKPAAAPLFKPITLLEASRYMDRQKLDIWGLFPSLPDDRRYQVHFGLYDQLAAALFDQIAAIDLRHAVDALDHLVCSDSKSRLHLNSRLSDAGWKSSAPEFLGAAKGPLTTRALYEFAALQHQSAIATGLGLVEQTALDRIQLGLTMSGTSKLEMDEYAAVFGMWSTAMNDRIFTAKDLGLPGHNLRTMWRCFPLEMYAALDLAFWTPLGPDGWHAPERDELAWIDVSPAWRFLICVVQIEKLNIPKTMLPNHGGDEEFTAIQEQLCQDFGWPTPIELARLWIQHLKPSETEGIQNGGAQQSRRWSLAMPLLTHRVRSPLSAFLGEELPRSNGRRFSTLQLGGPSPTTLSFSGLDEEIDHHTYARALMRLANGSSRRCLPVERFESFRSRLCEGSGIDSANPAVERYLRRMLF